MCLNKPVAYRILLKCQLAVERFYASRSFLSDSILGIKEISLVAFFSLSVIMLLRLCIPNSTCHVTVLIRKRPNEQGKLMN